MQAHRCLKRQQQHGAPPTRLAAPAAAAAAARKHRRRPRSLPALCSARPGSPARSNSVQSKLGRASSSKKWMLIAAAATAATIALAVGLGVGLSKGSSSDSSSEASASGGDSQPDTGTPAQLYSASGSAGASSPTEACQALARGTSPGSKSVGDDSRGPMGCGGCWVWQCQRFCKVPVAI